MSLFIYSLFPAIILLMFGGLLSTLYQLAYRPDVRIEVATIVGSRIALGVFFCWMCLIALEQQQVPVVSFGQLAAFLAFLIWAGHSYVQTRVPQKLLALLPMMAVVVLILAAVVAGIHPAAIPEKIKGFRAAVHIAFSLAGIAMLMGAGVYGAGTLILHRHLSRRVFDRFFSGLPSLEEMNRLRKVAIYAGWLLVSISLGSAAIWMMLSTESTLLVSHIHPMVTLWVIVTLLVIAEHMKWISQRRLAMLSVGLSGLVLALIVVSVIEIFTGAWL